MDVGYRGELRSSPNNIVDIMIYSFELQQWEAMRSIDTDADISIEVDTASISPTDFAKVEESVGIGRAAALTRIDDIMKSLEGKTPTYWKKLEGRLLKFKKARGGW